jgi:hypothetical protein
MSAGAVSAGRRQPRQKSASPDPDRFRFPDLVRAREAQQERLRAALLVQNRDLQRKLEDAGSPSRSLSEMQHDPMANTAPPVPMSAPDLANTIAFASLASNASSTPLAKTITPSPLLNHSQSRVDTAAAAAHTNNSPHAHHMSTVDVAAVIREVQDIVEHGQAAQMATLEKHQAYVEGRINALQAAMDDLHSAMLKDESTRSILRDEQMHQHLELCGELDSLRAEVAGRQRGVRDEMNDVTKDVIETLQMQLHGCEARIMLLEELPQQVRNDMSVLEDRFSGLAAGIHAERISLAEQRNEVHKEQAAELAEVLREAREKLAGLVVAATDCTEKTAQAQAGMQVKVQEAVARVAEQLEAEIIGRLDEQAERVTQTTQRQAMEHHNMQQDIQASLSEVRASVESSLMGMRRQYQEAVQEQLRAVVQQAEQFEAQRRAECPVADSDRVDLMVAELHGASTMLEGLMQNVANLQSGDPRLPARVDTLEARLAGFEVAIEGIRGAGADAGLGIPPLRISISVPVQTDERVDTPRLGREASVEEQVAVRAQRHLADELDKAADEVRLASARKAIAKAGAAHSPTSARAPDTARASLGAVSPVSQQESSREAAPHPHPRSMSSLLDPSRTLPTTREKAAPPLHTLNPAELQDRREGKELVLQRVQQLLRSIQATFHALTEQEEAQGHVWSRDKVAEVARQKQEMYARERQLLDQRNSLWQAVLEIKAEEDRRLQR